MSFAHGAQDGLKFIGIFYMYGRLVNNNADFGKNILIVLICALAMSIGVAFGGKRIVSTVGEKMVKLSNEDALCSDFGTAITLIIANFWGIPVSTTHAKTVSITGAQRRDSCFNKNKFIEIALAWGLTFPVCGIVSYLLMKIII